MSEDNSGKAVRSGIWYVISNVMIRAVGIITAPIYTRLLTTSETGFANNFNNYVSILYVITGLCLIYSVGRAKIDFGDRFDAYISAIQGLSSMFGLLLLAGVMICMPKEGMLGYNRQIIFILFAYLCLYPSIDYMQYKLRFEYKYKENIAISIFITVVTVILSVALILLMPADKGYAKILGTVIPSAFVALICYIVIVKNGKCLFDLKSWKYALSIGLPMIPHGLAMILLARIDVSMISKMCDYSAVGLYTSGYTIGTLLMFVVNAIGNAWIPLFNERLNANDIEAIRRDNKVLMEAGCFMTLMFIAVAPEAVKILYAKPYHESMWVVAPVALGTLCQYFYTNYVNAEIFYKKTALIALNSCMAAGINIFLNYVFIAKYGYIAAAYTTLAGYFILMILHYIASVHIMKKKIYQDGRYFAMLILTVAAGVVLCALNAHIIYRYLLAAVFAVILAFIWRDDISVITDRLKNGYKARKNR
ncbi:MAG: oligosaccharide flippase family protein [Lachnospiraceae bacterium]|nr:oligosaccharide flippase family protein [Lachnospiraceae bacterium]